MTVVTITITISEGAAPEITVGSNDGPPLQMVDTPTTFDYGTGAIRGTTVTAIERLLTRLPLGVPDDLLKWTDGEGLEYAELLTRRGARASVPRSVALRRQAQEQAVFDTEEDLDET